MILCTLDFFESYYTTICHRNCQMLIRTERPLTLNGEGLHGL